MVNTRHIEKNGLSFDCPDYYDIGKYPSSDKVYKSIVALSKNDRNCELYIMVFREDMFDAVVKRDDLLIMKNLELQNFTDVTINSKLPFCYSSHVYYKGMNLNSTHLFKFSRKNVISILGVSRPFVYYDFIEDMKIILDTISYDDEEHVGKDNVTNNSNKIFNNDFYIKCPKCGKKYHKNRYFSCPYCKPKSKKNRHKAKRNRKNKPIKTKSNVGGPVSCSKCGFGYNSRLHDSCPKCGNSSNSNSNWWILGLCVIVIILILIVTLM